LPSGAGGVEWGQQLDMQGEYRFTATRLALYEMLLDPELIANAMPGCERFEPLGDDTYDVTLRLGMSGLKGTYRGTVHVADQNPPDSYRLVMKGGGAGGTVTATASLALAGEAPATLLRYRGDLAANGALAALGWPMLNGAARLLIGQFMKAMEKQVRDRTV
jgi:carbon monoxide dehydrogenase subunit G